MNTMIFSKDINSKRVILVTGGAASPLNKEIKLEYRTVIAADSGVDNCLSLGLVPDAVFGDLDSISDKALSYIEKNKIKTYKYPVEKDMTDTELVLDYLKDKLDKDDELVILGFSGSRMDHTLMNILLLERYSKYFKILLINSNNIIQMLERKMIFPKDDFIYSLIALSDQGLLVTLKGFKYPLDRGRADFASSLAISNEIVADFGEIELLEGSGILIRSFD